MDANRLFALIGILGASLSSTGGIGFAVVQWILKRNDPESRANAARVLSDAAAGIVAEFQRERQELREEIKLLKMEMIAFKTVVRNYLDVSEDVIPLLSEKDIQSLKQAMKLVREQM